MSDTPWWLEKDAYFEVWYEGKRKMHCDEEESIPDLEKLLMMWEAGYTYRKECLPWVPQEPDIAAAPMPEAPTPGPAPRRRIKVSRYTGEVEQLCL